MESSTMIQLILEKEHNHSLNIDYDKKPFEDAEDKDREKPRESSRYKSKDERKRHRVGKDKESKDIDDSRSNVNSDREMRVKDTDKDVASRSDRKRDDRVDSEKIRHKRKREGRERNEKEMDNDRKKDRRREKDHARERDTEKDDKVWDRDYERQRERGRDKVRDKRKDREKDLKKGSEEGEVDRHRRREKRRDMERDDGSSDAEKERHCRKSSRMTHNKDYDTLELGNEAFRDSTPSRKGYSHVENGSMASVDKNSNEDIPDSPTKLEERILKMKEERLRHTSATSSGSEVLSWVNISRKLEERRNHEKEQALQLSRMFEEQDNVNEEEIDFATENLAGIKVLHGLEKVVEGGAVVLTLKDQNILSGGGINEDIDMLENVEIGEQKERDAAYMAAKKTRIYEDKFSNEAGSEKTILPQYDMPTNEGLALDERGQFSGEAARKLEELRRRLQGALTNNHVEDLNSYSRSSTDYYTQEEMLRFKKPKKKKSLRKKEKLDIDTLEAEAVSAGLGRDDLGSRNSERLTSKEEKERLEAEKRNIAYQVAYSKADEASKALRMEQTLSVSRDEDENPVFEEDDEELYKSVERARKLALKKQSEETSSGPRALALLASASANNQTENTESSTKENRVVFTEMEEFVWGLQLDEEEKKPEAEDVFMEEVEDLPPPSSLQSHTEPTGSMDMELQNGEEAPDLDETIEEPAVGKGLSGALKLLKERGALKDTVEWGGRNMDKKKSKLVGINDGEGMKEIRIERTDEFGRILTPKESFRLISHKFHGKGPGKMKQEKRMKQYQEELKLKKMKNSDTPSLSVERMKEAQARLKTPYLVLSGHVKPGQTSDPASGFATVEKEFAGGLTPMLGDRKVEHFLGIKK